MAAQILDGVAAPERSGVVMVTHRDAAEACSGAVIAPLLIATAKHCVFRATAEGDEPLPADGFRVSFGPDEAHPLLRYGESLRWIGMPEQRDVAAAVEAGEDVAVLRLDEPAPEQTALIAVRRSYLPSADDSVTLVGFGISELATASAGVRREAAAHVAGFNSETGQLQLEGAAACFGDSGGPVLFGADNALVAIMNRVGGESDGGFCEPAVTLASSIANARVRSLLLSECEHAGGCGPRDPDRAVDAGDGAPAARPSRSDAGSGGPVSRQLDGGTPDAGGAPPPTRREGAGGCGAAVGTASSVSDVAAWLLAVCLLRRSRRRGPARPQSAVRKPGRTSSVASLLLIWRRAVGSAEAFRQTDHCHGRGSREQMIDLLTAVDLPCELSGFVGRVPRRQLPVAMGSVATRVSPLGEIQRALVDALDQQAQLWRIELGDLRAGFPNTARRHSAPPRRARWRELARTRSEASKAAVRNIQAVPRHAQRWAR